MLTEQDIDDMLEFGEISPEAAAALRLRLQMNRREQVRPLVRNQAAFAAGVEGPECVRGLLQPCACPNCSPRRLSEHG